MQVQMPRLTPRFLPFVGGLDTTKQRLGVEPGTLQASLNYEPDIQGGYRRIGGFERFDGRARPSDAGYILMATAGTWGAAAVAGATVQGATSAATGVIAQRIDNTRLAVTMVTGTFAPTEVINISGSGVGTYSAVLGTISAAEDNVAIAAAAGLYRPLIGQPPGTGPSRVMVLQNTVYAIRAGLVYRATSTGWTAVPLLREISFTAGSSAYAEGSTLSKGGVTATVRRVVLISGTWGAGTAAGKLIITATTGGEFTAGAATGGGACTLSGASTAITLSAATNLDYVRASFINNQERIYACDGVNRPFEFDGTVLVPIDVPSSVVPTCVESDEVTLYFGAGAEIFASSVGTPYVYSAITGAAQLGAGANVVDLLQLTGGQTRALFVGTTRGPKVLYGTNKDNWQLTGLGSESACAARSAQPMKGGMFFDASGARSLSSTQNWGNFSYGLESQRIDSWLQGKTVQCSCIQADKTFYRVIFTDGSGVVATLGRKSLQWLPFDYGILVKQIVAQEMAGVTRMFMCDDSGWVYEANVGRSFDGAEIEAWAMTHSINAGSVQLNSTWRSGRMEAYGDSSYTIRVQSEFDDGDADVSPGDSVTSTPGPVGLRWDTGRWDASVWDGGAITTIPVGLRGVGSTMSVAWYSRSSVELPHTLTGLHLLVTPRRLKR